jgi:transposase InsO family protein
MCGVTKQSLHKYLANKSAFHAKTQAIISQAVKIRQRHPQIGCRTMYQMLTDPVLGRDRCEKILLDEGFRIRRVPNYVKTTVSQKHHNFTNLIEGLEMERINQVWQSDITYFIIPSVGVYYLVFIIDVYSRRILGFTANDHVRAEANVACLLMAIKARVGCKLEGLIHHSDRGGQYISKAYVKLLGSILAVISMSKTAWKNAYAERINGTIKNDYLRHRNITSLPSLRRNLSTDVAAYNHERPHRNLPGNMSPVQFENYLHQTPKEHHPKFKIYDEYENAKRSGLPPTQSIMETLCRFP